MKEVWYKIKDEVSPGTKVWDGYHDQYLTAPKEEGVYTLFEVADAENNQHVRFVWEAE